jgi:hypothetical protein
MMNNQKLMKGVHYRYLIFGEVESMKGKDVLKLSAAIYNFMVNYYAYDSGTSNNKHYEKDFAVRRGSTRNSGRDSSGRPERVQRFRAR